jgi:hypothetical protein
MGRQKLPAGQHGEIRTTEVAAARGNDGQLLRRKYVVAKTRLGVAKGPSKQIEARGATAGAARRALQTKLATLKAELEQEPTGPSGPTVAARREVVGDEERRAPRRKHASGVPRCPRLIDSAQAR